MRRVIFWDCDGTVMLANHSFLDSLTAACSEYVECTAISEADCRAFLKSTCSWNHPEIAYPDAVGELWWDALLGKLRGFLAGRGVAEDICGAVCRRFRENVIAYDYRLYDDALPTLARFRAAGFESYIISCNFPELPQVGERLGLSPCIDGWFLSADFGYEKPRPEFFRHALERIGSPDGCVMVGDNPASDIAGGQAVGMTTVLVHRTPASTDTARADLVCESLSAVADAIIR